MRAFLTRTHSTPEIYILIGTTLFAAMPFSVILDIIIDVERAAPNPECDSLGPVLSGFGPVVLVSTVVGFVASGVLVMLCALNKVSGLPVFTLTQKPIWKNALISTVFAPLIGLCLLGVGFYTWLALIPITSWPIATEPPMRPLPSTAAARSFRQCRSFALDLGYGCCTCAPWRSLRIGTLRPRPEKENAAAFATGVSFQKPESSAAQAETLDERGVTRFVVLLEVVQQFAALGDHHQPGHDGNGYPCCGS